MASDQKMEKNDTNNNSAFKLQPQPQQQPQPTTSSTNQMDVELNNNNGVNKNKPTAAAAAAATSCAHKPNYKDVGLGPDTTNNSTNNNMTKEKEKEKEVKPMKIEDEIKQLKDLMGSSARLARSYEQIRSDVVQLQNIVRLLVLFIVSMIGVLIYLFYYRREQLIEWIQETFQLKTSARVQGRRPPILSAQSDPGTNPGRSRRMMSRSSHAHAHASAATAAAALPTDVSSNRFEFTEDDHE